MLSILGFQKNNSTCATTKLLVKLAEMSQKIATQWKHICSWGKLPYILLKFSLLFLQFRYFKADMYSGFGSLHILQPWREIL